MDAVEARTIAKVSKRLVPFLIVCYFVAYLDRVNVSFAALTMNQDLGLSQTGFGVAEGRFHAAFPLFVAAAGIAVSTTLDDPTLKMLSLCVAGFGIFACLPVFCTFSWNRSKRTGYKVIRIRLKDGIPTGEYEDFVTGFVVNDSHVWGRPVGVAVAHDGALLVSEDASGTIWRITH
jgi:hypothetical protein